MRFMSRAVPDFGPAGGSVITLITMGLSFACLAWAMRSLPLGTAYTIWTGIGAVVFAVFPGCGEGTA
jgi:multidrug transporter EmrE-like cation transporter